MDIFGEFEEEADVTKTWHFRPVKRAENFVAQMGASNRYPHQRETVCQFDGAIRFGLACRGKHAVFAVKEQITPGQPRYIKSRFDQAIGKRNPHFEQVFQAVQGWRKWIEESHFNECGLAFILAGFGILGPFTHLGESTLERRNLTVNHNRDEELDELNEVGQSINETALGAMDNAALLIMELAALGAFKLHNSVDMVRVSAVHTQLRNEISEIIACTRNLAALREQLLGVNVKAELAA